VVNYIRFAHRYLKSKVESEELVQKVFMRIWDKRKNLNGELSFKSFMDNGIAVVLGILEISIFVAVLSLILFFLVLNRKDVTHAILGNYLLPFFISILGVILLSERITILMLLGGGLILISTLLATVYEKTLLANLKSKQDNH
jgi:drug/metabolite transporter (DMT)-like permease